MGTKPNGVTRTLGTFPVAGTVLTLLASCGGTQEPVADPSNDSPATQPDDCAAEEGTCEWTVAGIPVIFRRTPGNPVVAVNIYFRGGVATRAPEQGGLDELALSVVAAGGPSGMTREEWTQALDGRGSAVGGSSGYDWSAFSASCIVSEFDETWALVARAIREPAFDAEEVEVSRAQQLASIAIVFDDPDSAVAETARGLLFAGHPYANRPIGTAESVGSFTRDDLVAAWAELLVRERMLVVVVGDLDASRVQESVGAAFGDLPSDPAWTAPSVPALNPGAPEVAVLERADQPTNYILGYFAAPSLTDPDYPAVSIAMDILSDRLFEEVRTRRNLTYAVSSGLGMRRANSGYLYVTATDPGTTVPVMFETLDGMISEPVPAEELRDQIEIFLTEYYMGLQTNGAQASTLGLWELAGGGWERSESEEERLRAVTPEDIARVLSTWARGFQTGFVGNPEQVPEILRQR